MLPVDYTGTVAGPELTLAQAQAGPSGRRFLDVDGEHIVRVRPQPVPRKLTTPDTLEVPS